MIRYISLSIPTNKWNHILLWCEENKIDIIYKGFKYDNKYFNIKGSTDTYKKLRIKIPEVRLTGLAKLGNILNCNSDLLQEFSGILEAEKKVIKEAQFTEHWLVKWLLKVDSVEALKEVQNYDGFMTDSSKQLIKERINYLEGNPGDYEKWLQEQLKI